LEEIVAAPVYKTENTAVGIRCADHATPLYPQKLALSSPTSGGRSVGIVRLRSKASEFFLFVCKVQLRRVWLLAPSDFLGLLSKPKTLSIIN
jgi:hypothetical protein